MRRFFHCGPAVAMIVVSLGTGAAGPVGSHAPASPGSYRLHDDLELSLFAREPQVVDPVAITFDEFGRAYVVEMRDYPLGIGPDHHPGGTVRLLEDTDGDGRADRSTLFAGDLHFPTSIACWNGGVLVAAPPEILFLKDTDGDGKADLREKVLTGFRVGATDSNVNGLRWALDNWFHVVNGGNGGDIAAPQRNPGSLVSLGDRDLRFQPSTGEVQLTSRTGGGFGLVFDDWGHSFTTYNINHILQRVASDDVFHRFPGLPAVTTTESISDHGDMARIFPISQAQTRPNHPEQAGHFSAACGLGLIGHRGWPSGLQGSVLVCDVVGNLVHRDVLVPHGPIFRASRAPEEQQSEFFASRDNSFRPVAVEQGPDGALYLLDMQRDVIEHPDYIPRKLLEKSDMRAGDDRGRIYRILPRDRAGILRSLEAAGTLDPAHPGRELLPGNATPAQWILLLGSPNPWTRLTAQRLLVGQGANTLAPELRVVATESTNALQRLHALWVLSAFDRLDDTLLLHALNDPEPGLREDAVVLAASRLASPSEIRRAVIQRLSDDSPPVRFRAALDLTAFRPLPVQALASFLVRDCADAWDCRAGLAAAGPDARSVLRVLLRTPAFIDSPVLSRLDLVRNLASLDLATQEGNEPRPLSASLVAVRDPELRSPWKAAYLDGITEGLHRNPSGMRFGAAASLLLRQMEEGADLHLLTAIWRLAHELGLQESPAQRWARTRALRDAGDAKLTLKQRLAAVSILSLGALNETGPALFALLDSAEPVALQQAAFDILREHREPEVAEGLVGAWRTLAPALRPAVVNLLVYRSSFQDALLTALEQQQLNIGELNLDLEQRRKLLRRSGEEVRRRAAQFTSDDEYANRRALVDQWLARLPADGDPARGRPVFEKICAQCHRANGVGNNVGPELTGMSYRSVEDLVSNVLDPNMAMNPAYVAFSAELTNGDTETGILAENDASAVTLLQPLGRKLEIPRSRIRQLRSEGRSLMPEGLESGMTPQELRDVIAFIQEGPAPAAGIGGAR